MRKGSRLRFKRVQRRSRERLPNITNLSRNAPRLDGFLRAACPFFLIDHLSGVYGPTRASPPNPKEGQFTVLPLLSHGTHATWKPIALGTVLQIDPPARQRTKKTIDRQRPINSLLRDAP